MYQTPNEQAQVDDSFLAIVQPKDRPSKTRKITKGYVYPSVDLVRIAMLSDEVWFVATTAKLSSIPDNVYLVDFDKETKRQAVALGASSRSANVASESFQDLQEKILQFTQWRISNGRKSVIVIDPPPINYITVWEMAFAQIGCTVAWLDHECVPQESCYLVDPEKHFRLPLYNNPYGEGSELWGSCMAMREGESLRFTMKNPRPLPEEIARFRNTYADVVAALNTKADDRRFKGGWRDDTRTVVIERLDEVEYEEWLNKSQTKRSRQQ
jgi:hypothetical protein